MNNFSESPSGRQPALSGICYPEDPDLLEQFLENYFRSAGNDTLPRSTPSKALYAPHIDPRVGADAYRAAFGSLQSIRPKRVVILATAHYSGYFPHLYANRPFIGCRRPFLLPNGELTTDIPYLDRLEEAGEAAGFTSRDDAHLEEHSIELHLLFARHIWQHSFTVVPILIDTLDQFYYMPNGYRRKQFDRFVSLLQELDDENTFYLISGDLAHVGHKFGDPLPAANMKSQVEIFDRELLKAAAAGDDETFLELVSNHYDRFRTCGFPPLYTFLRIFPGLRGKTLDYHWWDDSEHKSAVSFGSIRY